MALYYSVNQSSSRHVKCPFNPAHVIEEMKLAKHLMKCKKSYPDVPLLTCPFNGKHLYTKDYEYQEHLEKCPDKFFMDRTIFERTSKEADVDHLSQKVDEFDAPQVQCSENWDDEAIEGSCYTPAAIEPGQFVNAAVLSTLRPLEKRQFHASIPINNDENNLPPGMHPLKPGTKQHSHIGRGAVEAYPPLSSRPRYSQTVPDSRALIQKSKGRGILHPPPGFEQ